MYQYFGGHIFFSSRFISSSGIRSREIPCSKFCGTMELFFRQSYGIRDTFKMSGVEGGCGSPNILVTSLVAVTKADKGRRVYFGSWFEDTSIMMVMAWW